MHALDRNLRNQLESAVKQARTLAEAGARAVLDELGVADPTAPAHLDDTRRELRRRLRAHGRQLGDSLNGAKTQSMDRLVEEVAYEHWHRMLFARFLAENQLLMYPDPAGAVPVSLQDCVDLAADEGAANGWELAARFAAQMLPQIFRIDSPVFALKLPANHQVPLETLLAGLPADVFSASDSLGWVYQFWQADAKERINRSEVKIGARELPAVTQLFTEPYMVEFLLDNALGAWWAARRLGDDDLLHAADEDTLRRSAAIPGVPLTYLRFVRETGADGIERWAPAAGRFAGWPERLAELKCLDPCCGSGHFLVALLLMLVPMRRELEQLDACTAVDAVLRDNLHGLEIDPRCVEIAAFALALTAWRYPDAGGYRRLPDIQVACSGLSVSVAKDEWKAVAREGGLGGKNLSIAMDWLHETFRDAPVLGSLIDPAKSDAARIVSWDDLSTALTRALEPGAPSEQREAAVVAQGLTLAATLLSDRYHWVLTNVPYLSRGKQNERLRGFCERHYPAAKNDLATVFLDRCLAFCQEGGSTSVVLPQNWLFLTSYRAFREKLLRQETWNLVARLGPKGFQTPMWDFNVQLITLTRGNVAAYGEHEGLFEVRAAAHTIRGIDAVMHKGVADKANALVHNHVETVAQARQLQNPDVVFSFSAFSETLLEGVLDSRTGLQTGDNPRFSFLFWEMPLIALPWAFFQRTAESTVHFSGARQLLRWGADGELIRNSPGSAVRGLDCRGLSGLLVHRMADLPATLFLGEIFDQNGAAFIVQEYKHLPAVWSYVSSLVFNEDVRRIDSKLGVTPAALARVGFDLDHWAQVAAEQYPNGLPQPYSDDPTQWIFHGHPCGSVIWHEDAMWTADGPLRSDGNVLQTAVARLLGYRWPAELDADMELAVEQREWVKRCAALAPSADDDGIVCIPPVRGERAAEARLRDLLAAAYGEAWSNSMEARLLASAEFAGKSLETWLRDGFFSQHCKLFQQRPFIWHVWDGLPDGFAALVNYHLLDHKRLETLIYTYLGDWISRQRQEIVSGIDGAQEKLAAAETLKQRLELILEGEAPYDIFVRWKPLAEQPIGWTPDLNDGVRLNIRPFLTVPDIRKKGAGVLRDKPNVHWKKDRGKDVESAPWFGKFEGERINDHHLSLAEKEKAWAASSD